MKAYTALCQPGVLEALRSSGYNAVVNTNTGRVFDPSVTLYVGIDTSAKTYIAADSDADWVGFCKTSEEFIKILTEADLASIFEDAFKEVIPDTKVQEFLVNVPSEVTEVVFNGVRYRSSRKWSKV